jgi:hypothetical protein
MYGQRVASGLSQTPVWAIWWTVPIPVSRFMDLRKSKTEREQSVLLAYCPDTREVKALAQLQHGFKHPDYPSCRAEGLKAADPRHRPLDPEGLGNPAPTVLCIKVGPGLVPSFASACSAAIIPHAIMRGGHCAGQALHKDADARQRS